MLHRALLISSLLLACSGCATAPEMSPAELAELRQPVRCQSKSECDLFWQRAQAWVVRNSGYRIQIANDVLIQTFGPFGSKTELAFVLVKEPASTGGSTISITASCDNIFGCFPDSRSAVRDLKAYMQSSP